jgi:REP element-mobilizing transposase RayT
VDRLAISRDDFDRAAWAALLERTVRRFELTLHAYCLMPNHFHLVVESELNDLSRGMHHLNGIYAQRFNRRHERSGHLFQERFGVRPIGDEAYLYGACAYVLDNPVRAGLCESADDWPWSAGPS